MRLSSCSHVFCEGFREMLQLSLELEFDQARPHSQVIEIG